MAILHDLSLSFYVLSFVALLFADRVSGKLLKKSGSAFSIVFLFLAWLLEGTGLSISLTHPAPMLGEANIFQIVAWVLALCFLIFSHSTRFFKMGRLFIGSILLSLALSSFFGSRFPLAPAGAFSGSFLATLHSAFFFFAFAFLLVNFLLSLLFLIKEQGLKKKSFSLIESIPPLDRLYDFFTTLLWVGFLLLSAGILSGSSWSKILFGVYLENDMKMILALTSWGLYALLTILERFPAWRGRRVVFLSIFAFGTLIASVLGVSHRL